MPGYPPRNCDIAPVPWGFQSSQEDIPWIIMVGKTASWGDRTVEGAWPWVLNWKMRECLTSGPSQFGRLSTHWGSQEEGAEGPHFAGWHG